MKIKETINGIEITGTWSEITEATKETTESLRENNAPEEEIKKWNKWRPRKDEELNKEVHIKTIDEAKLAESKLERDNKHPSDETKDAIDDINEAVKNINQDKETINCLNSSLKRTIRLIEDFLRKTIRAIEEVVYDKILRLNKKYYDSNLISASLGTKNSLKHPTSAPTQYKLTLTIKQTKTKQTLQNKLK